MPSALRTLLATWTIPAAFVEMVIIKVLVTTQKFRLVMVNLASMHLHFSYSLKIQQLKIFLSIFSLAR